ncbi:GtrA family protein [Aquimarina sp. RZ0]|uniref:GtrA family protein n=1 Tax=Aquimarina sp. RZ0 TaxID=2607730 RepID=UPI0011F2452D|nr:GtrA family protein [Aquimarina sp. RZ0]
MLKYIDVFYFIFRRFISLKTYRYAFCGGSNLVFDTVLYFIFFHFIFDKQNVDLYFIVMSPHIASLFFVFPITFTSGFILNKYITFRASSVATKVQFMRYLIIGSGAILLNYLLMKLLVDFLNFYPTPSRLITIFITIIYSYTLQNKFSFKIEKP